MTTSRSESSSTHHVQQATMALSALRDSLTALSMPYVLQGTAAAADKATLIRDQLGDYILPRLASLDAPLLAVVGGSTGAGKSTLTRVLVGLERASGVIRLDGRVLRAKERTRLGYVVMQDVHRQLFAESVSQEASAPQLERLDLAGLAERHPLSLSGGQKQRLVIATAVDQDARVIVLDEPTSGVDYRHLLTIAAELRSLADEGRVVVVISHDIEFLNECADHVIEIT